MRSLKIMHTEASAGLFIPANPKSSVGLQGRAYVFEITDIPDEYSDNNVIQLANTTTFLAARYDGTGRYTYACDELGEGKIIRV